LARPSKPSKIQNSSNEKPADGAAPTKAHSIEIPHTLSVRQLADLLQVSAIDIIKQLMRNGIMANINQIIGYETAAAIAAAFDYETRPIPKSAQSSTSAISEIKRPRPPEEEFGSGLKPRPPVVTIMGHVDHGKTRLLDAIRETNVMATEAGSITQHIGAYQAKVNEQKITFLDTPGHEAFTAMRARGAQVTDITVLVVAADDGVMPQTLEAIDHARAAGVPIVVAINKIDKPEANIDRVKQQLSDAGVVVEDWGGDTVYSLVSAKEKKGIPQLLENILLVAEMENLRANPAKPAEGTVIEAEMDKTKGPLATVLIHSGTLRVGDTVAVGTTWGRLKAMFNDTGKQLRKAEPSTPVEILGLNSVPRVGDNLTTVANEQQARTLIQKRQAEIKQQALSVNLSNLYEHISAGQIKELNVILKTDVQGSVEPIKSSLEQLGTKEVQVRVIHSGSGNITESDISLAIASKGLVIGFNTSTETGARRLADIEGVSIRNYDVIYTLTDDVDKALKGLLEPSYVDVIEGRAEVRAIFTAAKKQKVAGVYVTEGKVSRGASVRVKRKEQVVAEPAISSLKRFKDDVKEVNAGYECGIGFKDFNDFEAGDVLEFFRREKK
jgi:translation initiation factor IF-2